MRDDGGSARGGGRSVGRPQGDGPSLTTSSTGRRLVLPKPADMGAVPPATPRSAASLPVPRAQRSPPRSVPTAPKAKAEPAATLWVGRAILGAACLILVGVAVAFLQLGDEPMEVAAVEPSKPWSPPTSGARREGPAPAGAKASAPPGVRVGGLTAAEKGASARNGKRVDYGRRRKVARPRVWSKARLRAVGQRPGAGKFYDMTIKRSEEYKPSYDIKGFVKQAPYILVVSQPPGMSVFLDEVPAGMTPLVRRLNTNPAKLQVRVQGSGFRTVDEAVLANDRGNFRVGVNMVPTSM